MSQNELLLDSAPAGPFKSDATETKSRRRLGVIVTGVLGGSLVALYAVVTPFLIPALRKICLPFVPATTAQVANVFTVLRARSGPLVDIGSGDGRVVIAAAKRGFQASGFELNPWLVWYSRYKAWREGVHGSTAFHISDLWKVNLLCSHKARRADLREKHIYKPLQKSQVNFAQYSNVVIFGVPQMMDQLEQKLSNELPNTARVVACRFPFPTWVPEHTAGEGIDTVWVYDAKTFKSHVQHGMKRRTASQLEDTPESHT